MLCAFSIYEIIFNLHFIFFLSELKLSFENFRYAGCCPGTVWDSVKMTCAGE